jgi:hypothetical protein
MLFIVLTASGKQRHPILRAALFGTIALGTLTGGNVAGAQQGKPATGGDTTIGQQLMSAEADPNLPGMASPQITGMKLNWNFFAGSMSQPTLQIMDRAMSNISVTYLGWNDEGSLLKGDNGKIYVWNLKQNSLTVRYKGFDDIPGPVMASLRNSSYKADYLASKQPKPASRPVAPVQAAKNQGNIPDDDARKAIDLLGARQTARPSSGIAGAYTATGATLKGDMLTLTMADGTKKALKVERPAVPTAAASGDIAGTWLSFDANKIIIVQGDGTTTVTNMDARLRANFEQIKKLVGAQK